MKVFWLIVLLVAILVGVVGWAATTWMSIGGEMPPSGYFALALGVVFSLVIGVGLMALVFISSRRGYDDAAHSGEIEPPPDMPR